MSYEQRKEEYIAIIKAANDLIGLLNEQSVYDDTELIERMLSMDVVKLRDFTCESLGKLDVFIAPDSVNERWETREEFDKRMDEVERKVGNGDA